MFRHVLKRHQNKQWTWGPASETHIYLDEIDSAGHGANDVMEIVARLDRRIPRSRLLRGRKEARWQHAAADSTPRNQREGHDAVHGRGAVCHGAAARADVEVQYS